MVSGTQLCGKCTKKMAARATIPIPGPTVKSSGQTVSVKPPPYSSTRFIPNQNATTRQVIQVMGRAYNCELVEAQLEAKFQGFTQLRCTYYVLDDNVDVVIDPTNLGVQLFGLTAKRAMAKIPLAATLLSTGQPKDLQKLLLAAILHSEDEMLVITESELQAAQNYFLVTTVIDEEGAIVLTAKPK